MPKYNKLTKEEENIIIYKGTEAPFSGEYDEFFVKGYYHCKQCNTPLYSSEYKFNSGCGWPSFDDELPGSVKKVLDADGRRTEILCNSCGGHLGHLFEGERLTEKNRRYCVNSLSIKFHETKSAYYAGGCFWGVEHLLQQLDGVYSVESGYMGGAKDNPSYEEVCTGRTGHLEVVKVVYDPKIVNYETLTKMFFEIHDPTQANGQGPDIGEQYHSAIFFNDQKERDIVMKLISILKDNGMDIVTELFEKQTFWRAEEYHQDYYVKHNKEPYCHARKKLF